MAFEKVEKGSFGGNAQALVSLRKSESIGINSPALEKLDTDEDYVVMYHDEEENKLAITPNDGSDEDSYKMSISNGSATVGATSFLKAKGLVPDVTTRYQPSVEEVFGNESLVIDLDDEHDQYGSADDDEEE